MRTCWQISLIFIIEKKRTYRKFLPFFFSVRKWAKRKTFNRHFFVSFPQHKNSFSAFFSRSEKRPSFLSSFSGVCPGSAAAAAAAADPVQRRSVTELRNREKLTSLLSGKKPLFGLQYVLISVTIFKHNSPAFALGFRKPPCPRLGKRIPYHRVAFAVRQSAKSQKQPPVRRSRGRSKGGGKIAVRPVRKGDRKAVDILEKRS